MKHILITIAAVVLMGCGPTEPKAPKGSVHIYAQEGDIAAVKQHLAAGTDVNAKDDFIGMTILQSAALGGQKEIVEFLIAEGADVNAMGRTSLTPLDTALKASLNKEIADLLRKHGGKTGEELKGGEPVAEASQPKPSIVKAAGMSIHDAAEKGNIEVVKKHLADGADMNAKDKHGGTPLHRAALGGDKEIVELLITRGADVNTKSVSGGTALYVAVFNGRREITQLLIAKGADVNSKDNRGGTSLHSAAWHGHKEIAELLIAEGADVNSKGDVNGGTPLHIAAFRDQKETAKLLIAKGADVNAKMVSGAKKGNTPLDAANETGTPKPLTSSENTAARR